MTVSEIADAIKEHPVGSKPVLIAIEGFGGSGKTTFAALLAQALGSTYVIPIDDFIVKEKLTEKSWDKGAFDRKRLERQVLIPATTGQPVAYQTLLWDENKLSAHKTVPLVHYLIVEGISSYHPDIAWYYDYKIWIDTPIEIARERGRARDGSNENAVHWDLWAENDLRYQQKHHPERTADLIFGNQASHEAI